MTSKIPCMARLSLLALITFIWMPMALLAADYVPNEVLVKFKPTTTPLTITGIVGKVATPAKDTHIHKVTPKPGETVKEAAEALSKHPDIEFAQPNYRYRIQLTPNDINDPQFDFQWAMSNTGQTFNSATRTITGTAGADIKALAAWGVTTGNVANPVVVAVIDTGIASSHPDLRFNLWTNTNEIPDDNFDNDGNGFIDDINGWDFIHDDNASIDLNDHGSQMSGIIGARGNNGTVIAGLNWSVSIMPLQAFDENGVATTVSISNAIRYAVDNGAQIINGSFGASGGPNPGADGFDQLEYDAIQYAADNNVIFITAACNKGQDNDKVTAPCVPASYTLDNIIAVASSDINDAFAASFSSYGATSVDLAAPGTDVISTQATFINTGPTEVGLNSASGNHSFGSSLSAKTGCRAAIETNSNWLFGNTVFLFEGSTDAQNWSSVGAVDIAHIRSLVNSNMVYADLTAFDGEPIFYFRLRPQVGGQDSTSPLGYNLDIQCYGAINPNIAILTTGTSISTAFVSGTAALILAQYPDLSVFQLREQILSTVDQISNIDPALTLADKVATGGRLNAYQALINTPIEDRTSTNPNPTNPNNGSEPTLSTRTTQSSGGGSISHLLAILVFGGLFQLRRRPITRH